MKQEQQREESLTREWKIFYERWLKLNHGVLTAKDKELFLEGFKAVQFAPAQDQEVKTLQELRPAEEILEIEVKKEGYSGIQDWLINGGTYNNEEVILASMELYANQFKSQAGQEELINACKYGYEFHATTSFPDLSFEDGCKNNFLQVLSNR